MPIVFDKKDLLLKYGIFFLTISILLVFFLVRTGGYAYGLVWPALSFFWVALAYFRNNPSLLGKQDCGKLGTLNYLILLPFFLFTSFTWNLLRWVSSEEPFHQLDERFVIGRRLTTNEFERLLQHHPINNVVDLTSEFSEAANLVSKTNYFSFPILDSSIPTFDDLIGTVNQLGSLEGVTYIHCAQGHGRTGLIVAAIFMQQNFGMSVEESISVLRKVRPSLDCNRVQKKMLNDFYLYLSNS